MTAPTCLFCGYSRSVPVAGCDHSTVPTVGEEMASAFRAMELLKAVPEVDDFETVRDLVVNAFGAWPPKERALAALERIRTSCAERVAAERRMHACTEENYCAAANASGRLDAALSDEREKGNLLAAELVDLQRQVVSLQAELEQERRESGRLRADLENARQLLDEAERGGGA